MVPPRIYNAVFHGLMKGKRAARWAKNWPGRMGRRPATTKLAIAGGAGAFGFATGDGDFGERLERGLGFAVGAGLAMNKKVQQGFIHQSKVFGRASSKFGIVGGVQAMSARAFDGKRGIMMGMGLGAAYGAIDEDTSIMGGALAGGGLALLGKGAAAGVRKANINRNINQTAHKFHLRSNLSQSRVFGGRTGAAAGGAIGLMTGGPVGMAVGAGAGAVAGRTIQFGMKHPLTGALMMVGGAGTAVVGASVAEAISMHQRPRDTNFGADGDLALGLHSLRHG